MRLRFLLAAAMLAIGCGDSDPLEPLVLSATLTTSAASVAVGQPVTVTAEAQGNYLLSLELAWGDDDTDVSSIEGARTARWTPSHTYAQPGTYTIRFTVEELRGTISRTATVNVTGTSPAR